MRKDQTVDVLILGAGVAGLALAFRAAQLNLKVLVIGETTGRASEAALGISTFKGLGLAASPLFTLKLIGHKGLPTWFDKLEAVSGQRLSWSQRPVLEPFSSVADYLKIKSRVYRSGFMGTTGTQILSFEEALYLGLNVQFLSKSVRGFFVYNDALWFDPGEILHALEKSIETLGAQRIEAKVADFRIKGPHVHLEFAKGPPPFCIQARALVLACARSSNYFLRSLGFFVPNLSSSWGETASFHSNESKSLGLVNELHGVRLSASHLNIGSSSKVIRSDEFTNNDLKELRKSSEEIVDKFVEKLGLSCVITEGEKPMFRLGERLRAKDRAPIVDVLTPSNLTNDALVKVAVLLAYFKSGFQIANPCAELLLGRLFPETHESLSLLRALGPSGSRNLSEAFRMR